MVIVGNAVLLRVAAARYLRDCGFTVLEARDGPQALEILRSSTSLALVFADVKLPGTLTGVDLAG